MRLSESFKSALRFFTYYYFNNTLGFVSGVSKLSSINYLEEMNQMPSSVTTVFAVFSNTIKINQEGEVLNFDYALEVVG